MTTSPGGATRAPALSDRLEPNPDRTAGDVIDGEAIIINLATGAYYSLPGIGGDVWSMIESRLTVSSMLDEIVAAYDVAHDEARRDLDAVLAELLEEGLVRLSDGGEGSRAATPAAGRKPYERPRLQVYRDMEALLALDPPAPGMNEIVWRDRRSPDSK